MMTTTEAPLPPQDLVAEKVLLGACMTLSSALDDAAERVTPEDFYRPAHGELFAAMLTMRDAGREVDAVTLAAAIGTRVMKLGGLPYLHDLYSSVPTASNAAYYAEIVNDKATRRRLVETGQRTVQIAFEDASEPGEVVERARQLFDDLAVTRRRDADVEEVGDAADSVLMELAADAPVVTSTGWRQLDDLHAGGLRPGTLTVIGARPSVGKSLIGCNMALNAALHGNGALFVSLEMTKFELVCRMLSNLATIPLSRLMAHKLGDHDSRDWQAVQRAHDRLDGIPLGLTDNPYLGLTSIRSLARDRARTPRGLKLIVVDYLGLIRPADLKRDRREQVDAISRGLKLMAKELAVPVVALHQLNRGSEQRSDRRPILSDLRESGAIEQDADNVWLLHREAEDPRDPTTQSAEIEVIVAKNRQGRTDKIRLAWAPEFSRAETMDGFH